MKKVSVLLALFLFTAIICYAGDRVRGELRREINGFQWYCYKNKEAYTIDGRRLFTDLKGVSEIRYVAADKDDKEGCFVVKYKGIYGRGIGAFTVRGSEIEYRRYGDFDRTSITFSNPSHKEYYTRFKSFHSDKSLHYTLYDSRTSKGIFSEYSSYKVEGNYLIFRYWDAIFKEDSYFVYRSDGKRITERYGISTLSHPKGSDLFICYKRYNEIEIYDSDGNMIIVCDSRYYKESVNVVIVQTQNGTGVLSHSGKWVVSPDRGYSITEITNGNTQYFKTRKDNHYGLLDSHGKQVIPTEMDDLESAGSGYFKFKHHGFWGVINSQGNVLIDTDRGYTSISDFTSYNKRFAYTMNGYRGECDATGKQISKTKIETASSSTGSSTSSSSSSSSTTSKGNQGNQQKTVVVEHHRDPVPMQQWQACMGCGGMGTMGCDHCGGSGTRYVGDRLRVCSRCNGQGVIPCNVCYGNKGQYITVYR